MIIETARILLSAAGSRTYITKYNRSLKNLTNLFCLYPYDWIHRNAAYTQFIINKGLLAAELIEMFLKHEGQLTVFQGTWSPTLNCNSVLISASALVTAGLRDFTQLTGFHNLMDKFGDVFRYHVLAWSSVAGTAVFTDSFANNILFNEFLLVFITIAQYSSQPGHSKKLIRLVVNTLSANQLIQLRNWLTSQLQSMAESPLNELTSVQNTLEWIRQLETPCSLMYLTRCAITPVIPMFHLRESSLSSLGIPKTLEQYLLFRN